MSREIFVYADWVGLRSAHKLGVLHVREAGNTERMEFEYCTEALGNPLLGNVLDPRIGLFAGRQYPQGAQQRFGLIADASPDRWGEVLMRRRHERDVRSGLTAKKRLQLSDYLLGVHDEYRVGALRFKGDESGPFLDNQHDRSAPPMTSLRELESASRAFEAGEDNGSKGQDWLAMLIAPGGSLGGARPKASVRHPDDSLWIAKFPSNSDSYNIGAWEMVVNALASSCKLRVAKGMAQKFASDHHCFMVQRFDRTPDGGRVHFASAMTLTEHIDGDDHSTGASYLDIARVLVTGGARADEDLKELWRRILFNMLVSNTDDHLRNHGFLLDPGKGWILSPAYDMNPVPHANGLKLNVSENDNELSLELARQVCEHFRVKLTDADKTISDFKRVISSLWSRAATFYGLGRAEREFMAPAFRLADE